MKIPIVYYAFNRPEATKQSLAALSKQSQAAPRIVAIVDGPRHPGDQPAIDQVIAQIKAVNWATVDLIVRPTNLGCAGSIVAGLNHVLAEHQQAVVVEDDVIVSVRWYEVMRSLLIYYQDEKNVFSVGGYPSINDASLPGYQHDVIISPRFSCWGWGTWASRWTAIAGEMLGGPHAWTADTISTVAGDDIPHMIRQYPPQRLWDGTIAAACLHRGWQHALTRRYLVYNLGSQHRPSLPNQVPVSYAPPSMNPAVIAAVRAHVAGQQ